MPRGITPENQRRADRIRRMRQAGLTLKQCGAAVGLSRERIRQIILNAERAERADMWATPGEFEPFAGEGREYWARIAYSLAYVRRGLGRIKGCP